MIQNREMTGIISAPQRRLVTQKMPGAFDARDRREPVERVSDTGMRFLPVNVSDAMPPKPVFRKDPVPARVGAESVMLYRGMTLKALGSECSLSA